MTAELVVGICRLNLDLLQIVAMGIMLVSLLLLAACCECQSSSQTASPVTSRCLIRS